MQALLAMQRQGVSRPLVDCLFTTLQHSIHQVRTGFGDSTICYGGSQWIIPLHGIGQGNGAGPAIWVVISTPLLNLLRKKGYGCELVDPISGKHYKLVGYAFIDDTDIIESKPSYVDSIQTSQTLQQAMDVWEGSLNATCGAVVPKKTYWYLIDFHWEAGIWRYCSIKDCPAELFVKDLQGVRKKIRRCEVWDAQETLGIHLAPDGNTFQQAKKMIDLAKTWGNHMRTGKITRHEAWVALNTTIMRTLIYPLPALKLLPRYSAKPL